MDTPRPSPCTNRTRRVPLAGEPPALPESFTPDAKAFVRSCLEKDHERRADSDAMAVHPWVAGASRDWTRRVAEWLEGVP